MSNLLVQNIKHTNGTTAQTVDTSGRTTAVLNNDTTYRSDNGAVTQNMVQGLAKVWINYNMNSSSSIYDSLNVASLTDNGTGDASVAVTNNLNNDDFAQVDGVGDEGSQFNNSRALGISSNSGKTTTGTRFDTGGQTVNNHYDFQENNIVIHGDLA